MGTNNIAARTNGQTIDQTWFNDLLTAISQDVAPRNSSGAPTDGAGNLGQSALQWLRAYIKVGYFECGDIKIHHSYNGAAPVGHGWMKCDGRQITQANYDTEHGSGSWASYIGSTTLLNKYLPDFTNKYPVGGSVTQSGIAAITSVGNSGHSAPTPAHNHKFYNSIPSSSPDQIYDSSGSPTNISSGTNSGTGKGIPLSGTSVTPIASAWTASASAGSMNIQPESIVTEVYMRII